MISIASRVALVTGAASGLGKAAAARIIAGGGKAVILDVAEETGAATAKELGPNALFVRTDVTSEEEVNAALDAAEAAFGRVNCAVNCAGIAPPSKIVSRKGAHSLDLFNKVLSVNTSGTFNVTRLSAARMVENEANDQGERGCIVNTASIAAFEGQIGQAAYAASKGAVVGMMLPIARELASKGVRVNTIAPGLFLTPLLEGLPEQVQNELGAQVPFPSRLGRPDEYGALVQSLLENPMMNGEVVRIDGALRMPPK